MNSETCHKLLGLSQPSSLDEIKSAYRCLAKKYHPDKDQSAGATDTFQKLNQAYQFLISVVYADNEVYADSEENTQSEHHDTTQSLNSISLSLKENTFYLFFYSCVTIDQQEEFFD